MALTGTRLKAGEPVRRLSLSRQKMMNQGSGGNRPRTEPWGIPAFNEQQRTRSLSKTPVGEMKEKSEKSVRKRISKGISHQGVKCS